MDKKITNKKLGLFTLIFSAVFLGIIATIITLSFVQRDYTTKFKGYKYVELYNSSSTSVFKELHKDDATKDQFKDFDRSLNTTGFSIMHALLEGKWSTAPKFYYDDDNERIKAFKDEVNGYTASGSEYMIVLNFGMGNTQTMSIENTEIKYDLIKFAVGDSNTEIAQVKVYAYNFKDMQTDPFEYEKQYINPFYVYLNTTDVYRSVQDIMKK